MEANQLRIGNLVYMDNKIVEITGILKRGFYFGKCGYAANILNWFQPIPLTEEWLLRFGFEKEVGRVGAFYRARLRIIVVNGLGSIAYLIDEDSSSGSYIPNECKYVNQLQNLYWCLVGEELTIKE